MQLTYRGIRYDSTLGLATLPEHRLARQPYTLKYRGTQYTVSAHQEQPQPIAVPNATLMYRGVAYQLNGAAPSPQPAFAPPRRQPTEVTAAALHRENLYRNVQRRLQVAKAQGNDRLISLLEQELQQIA